MIVSSRRNHVTDEVSQFQISMCNTILKCPLEEIASFKLLK